MLIVNGANNGSAGELMSVDTDKFSASIRLENGRVAANVPYEDFSKLSRSS